MEAHQEHVSEAGQPAGTRMKSIMEDQLPHPTKETEDPQSRAGARSTPRDPQSQPTRTRTINLEAATDRQDRRHRDHRGTTGAQRGTKSARTSRIRTLQPPTTVWDQQMIHRREEKREPAPRTCTIAQRPNSSAKQETEGTRPSRPKMPTHTRDAKDRRDAPLRHAFRKRAFLRHAFCAHASLKLASFRHAFIRHPFQRHAFFKHAFGRNTR